MGRSQADPCPSLKAALPREFGRDFHEYVRRFLLDSFHGISHVSFMKMFKRVAIVEVQIEFSASLLLRFGERQRESQALPSGNANCLV